MIQFLVGIIVGASLVGLMMILVAPSRRVRAEGALPPDVEAKLLLHEDPDQPTIPPPPRVEHPAQYTPEDLAALQRIGRESRRKRKH